MARRSHSGASSAVLDRIEHHTPAFVNAMRHDHGLTERQIEEMLTTNRVPTRQEAAELGNRVEFSSIEPTKEELERFRARGDAEPKDMPLSSFDHVRFTKSAYRGEAGFAPGQRALGRTVMATAFYPRHNIEVAWLSKKSPKRRASAKLN